MGTEPERVGGGGADARSGRQRPGPWGTAFRTVRRRPRLFLCLALASAVVFTLPSTIALTTRLLVGWDVGAGIYIASAWRMMLTSDVGRMRSRAAAQDEAEWVILLLTLSAGLASLVAIGAELHGIHAAPPTNQGLRIALAAGTILVSWFFVHTIMALHYAHDYYAPGQKPGLDFPEHLKEPGYWDFLYVAFTIGAASQTSDVTISSVRIRRVALAHTILSFLFNTTVLALAINVGASLI